MSYGIRERDPVPQFRNNISYFSMKFEAPKNDVCVGSAYGSGTWYPDFGGFPGAPEQNRWITPAESWFEHNCLKHKRELKRRATIAAIQYAKPTRKSEASQTDRKIDIYRGDDPFIKGREHLWIAENQSHALEHETTKRKKKLLNGNNWQRHWGRVPSKTRRPAPRLIMNMKYTDVINLTRKDTNIFFPMGTAKKHEDSTDSQMFASGKRCHSREGRDLGDDTKGGAKVRSQSEFADDSKLVPWDISQPRDWNDTKKDVMRATGSTYVSSGVDNSNRTTRTQFRETQSDFSKSMSNFRKTM
ncbi:unnamed protein product [Amoebophrya sp. A120]|nr:unnamed protein product [Amoebophrya sp. A120]|eukprot:GSA120T00022556001.1